MIGNIHLGVCMCVCGMNEQMDELMNEIVLSEVLMSSVVMGRTLQDQWVLT